MIQTNRAVAVELFTSGMCNLACEYCYIPKTDNMRQIHDEILTKIESGEYVTELVNLYGDRLEYLGFWGTEPLLTLLKTRKMISQLFDKFPKLHNLSMSTNMMLPPRNLIEFIESLPRDRKIQLDVQVSIDGPAEITDSNRFGGSTEKIVNNTLEFAALVSGMDLGQIKAALRSKPTWNSDNIKLVTKVPEALDEYFNFFDDFISNLSGLIGSSKNISIDGFGATPTLVVPGKYTQSDGHMFATLCHDLHRLEKTHKFKHIHGCLNNYVGRLKRVLDYGAELYTKPAMFTCSGGDSNWQLGVNKDFHICHRSLFLNRPEYINEIECGNASGRKFTKFDMAAINNVADNYTADINDDPDMARLMYVLGNYHNYTRHKYGATAVLIHELAYCGQISKIYGENESLRNLACIFINSGLSCPMENVLNTGSLHATPISLLRMFLNGAFEEIVKRVGEDLC